MTILRACFAAATALLLTACTTPQAAKAPVAQQATPQPWYENEIRAFEAADRDNPPEPGQVLFTGSSSIRMWSTLADDMAPARVLNRGFGGSRTPEVLDVMDRIVFPYHPAAIAYYCGDNDLGDNNTDSLSAAVGFITFAERVHARQPGTPILYLSIKPSIARWKNWPAMDRANKIVANYAAHNDAVEFLDLGPCLLGPDGTPDPALFRDDGLHLNATGYARWTQIVRPRVLKAIGKR